MQKPISLSSDRMTTRFLAALLLAGSWFLFAGTLCAQTPNKTELSPDAFQQQIAQKDVQVLDVRTPGEYQKGHIANSLQADWNDRPQFIDRVAALDKTKPVYVYCLAGGRSAAAAEWMRANGYATVVGLKGGINAWKSADKPLEGVMAVKAVSLNEYQALVNRQGWILVDFGAVWCPPCKKMQPVIDQLIKEAGSALTLVNMDGGSQTELMKALKVEGLPTFILYKNGQEKWRKQGITTLEEFKQQLRKK